jgi:hypothetical protein
MGASLKLASIPVSHNDLRFKGKYKAKEEFLDV